MSRIVAPPAGFAARFAAWLALGIDPADVSPDTLRRIRVLSGATFLLIAQSFLSITEFWVLGLHSQVLAIACAATLAIGNLMLLHRTHDVRQAAHIALVILTGPLVLGSILNGGIEQVYFSWFYALPVAAAVTLDVRGVLLWLGLTLALTLGFWTLPYIGIELVNQVPEPMRAVQVLVDRAMVLIGLTVIGVSFVTGQRRGERDLAHANLEIERESTYLRLLMHAAVSANQSTSLDEALRECVKSVCHAMGWTAGHVYAVNEQGMLVSSRIIVGGDASLGPLLDLTTQLQFAPGQGLPGRAFATRKPVAVQENDLEQRASEGVAGDLERTEIARGLGLRAGFAVPVLAHGEVVAVVEFVSRELLPEDERFEPVLGLVGAQLGRAAERAALEARLRQVQKVEAIAQLAAGLAHEINNPMAYVRANLNLLRADWDALRKELEGQGDAQRAERLAECDDLLAESAEGVDRTIAIVRDVRDLARGADAPAEPVDLEEVLDAALRETAAQAGPGVRLERTRGDVPPVPGSAGRLRQVVVNLVVNAIHAIGGQGTIRIATERRAKQALLVVEDDGPGIAPEIRARLFEPFFTTKPVGQGTGLGLYVCAEIVRSHGGEIRVDSEPGRGSRFEVRLPYGRESGSEA